LRAASLRSATRGSIADLAIELPRAGADEKFMNEIDDVVAHEAVQIVVATQNAPVSSIMTIMCECSPPA
jgi:hypothetical protein